MSDETKPANTKEALRDAAHALHELIAKGEDNVSAALQDLCAALRGEMDRQLAYDAQRAAATVPGPSSSSSTPTT